MKKLTDNEVVTQSILKAIKQGFNPVWKESKWEVDVNLGMIWLYEDDSKKGDSAIGSVSLFEALHSKEFCIAFWGEEVKPTGFFEELIEDRKFVYRKFKEPVWKTHLTIMVLEDDYIEYLRRFV